MELNGLTRAPMSGWLATGGTWGSRRTWWWLRWVEEGSKWEKMAKNVKQCKLQANRWTGDRQLQAGIRIEAGNEKPRNAGATQKLDVKIANVVHVSPARETFGGLYALSNLDQTFPYVIENVITFKGERRGRRPTVIETIRESLAKALVEFYPLAGRLVMGSDERMAVRCTGEGVPFVEATSEDDIAVLGDISAINPAMLRKLVKHSDGAPTILEVPLLTVQVTTFKCGGIVVGIVMNHVIVDGKALMDFIAYWTDLARAKPPSVLPFLDRSVLRPRRPPHIDFPHHEYAPRDRRPGHVVDPQTKPLVYKSFCFKPHTLIQLKKASRITTQIGSSVVPTTFEVISALVWISRTKALGIGPHETTKLLTAVDGRPKFDPPLPSGYFGNGIAWSCAECSAGELTRNPFSFAVRIVHEALATVTESYIRSAINYVELNKVLVDCGGSACCISKWSQLHFYKMDFGFGKPFQVAPATVPDNLIVVPSRSRESDELVVSLGLTRDAMDVFSKLIQHELTLKSKF
ncbi:omega-hydroxypalmitate O-feruloyl transferase-like [Eucalyptus grandis]|uniref:omega-hydroxypalmitate O-feruloyl transferase-like n=1 Tax=Eucalyptus grandis TaxID=71139 RepID=UPI00192E77AC|nr:omega-hydroxypalmitate O-feruloyl transferase-like [Eucalyptus grandis]